MLWLFDSIRNKVNWTGSIPMGLEKSFNKIQSWGTFLFFTWSSCHTECEKQSGELISNLWNIPFRFYPRSQTVWRHKRVVFNSSLPYRFRSISSFTSTCRSTSHVLLTLTSFFFVIKGVIRFCRLGMLSFCCDWEESGLLLSFSVPHLYHCVPRLTFNTFTNCIKKILFSK